MREREEIVPHQRLAIWSVALIASCCATAALAQDYSYHMPPTLPHGDIAILANADWDGDQLGNRMLVHLAPSESTRAAFIDLEHVRRVVDAMSPDTDILTEGQLREMLKAMRAQLGIAIVRDSVDRQRVHLLIIAAWDSTSRDLGSFAVGGYETVTRIMSERVNADSTFQRIRAAAGHAESP